MRQMETAFVIALRIWVGAWGAIALIATFWSKGQFRWGRRGRGPLIQPQWLGRLFLGVIGLFLIMVAIFLKAAPKR